MGEEKNISVSDKVIEAANSIQQRPADEFREQLTGFVNDLINEDFNALMQVLYRIDVNEKKLKTVLKQHKNIDASSLIADLIIERQLQKIATKEQFKGKGEQQDDGW